MGTLPEDFFLIQKLLLELFPQTVLSFWKIFLVATVIDSRKFETYVFEATTLYIQLHGWHLMSSTINKILMDAATVISQSLLPGQLSEEAAEAWNKHFRLYRQNFSRKFDSVKCNRDIFNRLLLTSDLFLNRTRTQPRKKNSVQILLIFFYLKQATKKLNAVMLNKVMKTKNLIQRIIFNFTFLKKFYFVY